MDPKTKTTMTRYNRIAGAYDYIHSMMEQGIMKQWRKAVWSEVRGNTLEVGVGTGSNFPYYPANTPIIAIDFSNKMLEKAKNKALNLHKNVNLRWMDVQNLDFPAETFDTIVTTCVFCSVPNPIQGLKEIKRVCKRDGRIIMLEHVRSQKPVIGRLMDLHNPVIVRLTGANINRNTAKNLEKAGLIIKEEQNLLLDIVKLFHCIKD